MLKSVTTKGRVQKAAIASADGATVGQVEKDQQKLLTLTLMPSDLSTDAILEALRPVIDQAKIMRARRR